MRFIISMIVFFLSTIVVADDFVLKTPAYVNNGKIPADYTCDGKNISPLLTWENPPANTKSFALVFLVTDWPMGVWYDWILFNIPP